MAFHKVQTVEEVYHYHLDGPFQFCKNILKSQIRRCYSSVYDLSPEKLGAEGFDLIFAGDIFLLSFLPSPRSPCWPRFAEEHSLSVNT